MAWRMVMYDIESDALRTRLARRLEALGFVRLQYSIFCGNHTEAQWEYCAKKLDILLSKISPPDKCYILPVSGRILRNTSYFGDRPELEGLLHEKLVYWL
ncbi:MAG: CRISPR-associated endonuclease Cas2 [Saprospiraceae bacterium]|nr:CRISPR-associated endonuclease Cas2 [Saprospiraceae bacterium]